MIVNNGQWEPAGSGNTYQASQAIVQRPWYQALMASWGNPTQLSQAQKDQLVAATKKDTALVQQFPALAGNIEATDHGMIQPKGTFVRDAIIAGTVMGGAFAAPAIAGAMAGGGGASVPVTQGIASSTSLGLPVTAAPSVIAPAVTHSALSTALTSPSLWGTIASTVGNIYSTNKQIDAADRAAQIAADASKYGTDAQTAASKAAEAFARQQAEAAYIASETANKANYGQYLAREHRLQSVGDLLGAGPRETPAYVPQPDPMLNGPSSPQSVGQVLSKGSPAASAVNWTADPDTLGKQLTGYFASKGVAPTEVPYWVSKAGELVARGKEINDPAYADKRLAAANILGGGGQAAPAVSKPAYQPYVAPSIAQLFAQYAPANTTAPLVMPRAVGSYF